ncbi:hypothetical protein O5D80_003841 [Batrachochytrium dendrobatidis]|nr:hypothetical protein O5D80_003841 [Batrachochytrium dendrobatidis]
MKFIDILFILVAAATANATLLPADEDGLPQASGPSNQVAGTSGQASGVSGEEWETVSSLGSDAGSSIFGQGLENPNDNPENTGSNQETLDEETQQEFDNLKEKVELLEKKQKEKCKFYFDNVKERMEQGSKSTNSRRKSRPKHNPNVEKRLEEECQSNTKNKGY